MAFTDDDLKLLKQLIGAINSPDCPMAQVERECHLIALISRLEAAEGYIADPWSQNLETWRKSKGE
jgi:hypothetical protein